LIGRLLIIRHAHAGEFDAFGDVITGLHATHSAVGAADLTNAIDNAGGLEGEIDLHERGDGSRVTFRRFLMGSLNNTGADGWHDLFDRDRFSTRDGEQQNCSDASENVCFVVHFQILPKA
jgi:hypothetical protein